MCLTLTCAFVGARIASLSLDKAKEDLVTRTMKDYQEQSDVKMQDGWSIVEEKLHIPWINQTLNMRTKEEIAELTKLTEEGMANYSFGNCFVTELKWMHRQRPQGGCVGVFHQSARPHHEHANILAAKNLQPFHQVRN